MKRTNMFLMSVFVVVGLVASLVWAGLALAQTKELVVAAWGDPMESGWRKSLIPNFEKKYGAKIVWVPGGGSAATLAKLLAQKDNPQTDVAMLDDGPHRRLVAAGLVERIDRSRLTNAKDLFDLAFEPEDYGIGISVDGTALLYNTKVFAENKWAPPTSWLDLSRPELRGKVFIQPITLGTGLCHLLALNRIAGQHESKSVDPGFAELKKLMPHVVTVAKTGEVPTLIQQRLAVAGIWTIGYIGNLAATGVPVQIVYPKEGVCGFKQVATILKGRPNQDLAYKFIDMVLSKEEQENTAKFVGNGPLNKHAMLDPEVANKVLYGSEYMSKVWIPDWQVVNDLRAAWTERWNKEIERR